MVSSSSRGKVGTLLAPTFWTWKTQTRSHCLVWVSTTRWRDKPSATDGLRRPCFHSLLESLTLKGSLSPLEHLLSVPKCFLGVSTSLASKCFTFYITQTVTGALVPLRTPHGSVLENDITIQGVKAQSSGHYPRLIRSPSVSVYSCFAYSVRPLIDRCL